MRKRIQSDDDYPDAFRARFRSVVTFAASSAGRAEIRYKSLLTTASRVMKFLVFLARVSTFQVWQNNLMLASIRNTEVDTTMCSEVRSRAT